MPTLAKQPLHLILFVLTILGNVILLSGLVFLFHHLTYHSALLMIEISVLCALLAPWSIRMPSGASWRPGIPLLLLGIFTLPKELAILISLPGLLWITARAHARLPKYLETFAHVTIGLYISATVYAFMRHRLGASFPALILSIVLTLLLHLIINRFISAMIVAKREQRPLLDQLQLSIKELHWGYLNSYLLVFMSALLSRHYPMISVFLATAIQVGIFSAINDYNKVKLLQKSAWTDGLTGIENRNAWESHLREHEYTPFSGSLIVVDVDNFKEVNDQFGHLTGDEVLRDVADALVSSLPRPARHFRYGGDEFIVYSPHPLSAEKMDMIRSHLSRLRQSKGRQNLHVEISMGLATASTSAASLSEVLQLADMRMYEEKQREKMPHGGFEVMLPSSLLALTVAIEQKDRYTAGHNLRVAFYALKLAQKMGLDSQRQKAIYRGSIVHDIGKISTPDAILNKRGTLTPDERQWINQHPVTGFEICKKLGFTTDELDVVLFHHERFDGAGYPRQLREMQIPLVARIAAVADVYDALTTVRSFRDAWRHEEAMDYIRLQTGSAFDPACVAAWDALNTPLTLRDQYANWQKEPFHA